MPGNKFRLGLPLLVGTMFLMPSVVHAADAFTVGQKVEVREGDTWSPASILAHEGRKYQVHYADAGATDEWVTTDRIRVPGTAGSAAPKADDPAKYGGFKVGDKVEVKWGGMWRKADILK